jgi:hypothetical protein
MRRKLPLLLLLTLALTAFPGCEGVSFITQIFKKQTPAVHKIDDRPTLVLVDDPQNNLGDPMWAGIVANSVAHRLKKDGAVSNVIAHEKLYPIAERLGNEFYRTPADQLGREVGAQQVIVIFVQAAEFNAQPGTYKPSMLTYVKLVDAAKGERIWPKVGPTTDESLAIKGHAVQSSLNYKISSDETTRGDAMVAMKKLCERAGRDVAWLFYNHSGRQPGEPFED